jgi:hypothetical protein
MPAAMADDNAVSVNETPVPADVLSHSAARSGETWLISSALTTKFKSWPPILRNRNANTSLSVLLTVIVRWSNHPARQRSHHVLRDALGQHLDLVVQETRVVHRDRHVVHAALHHLDLERVVPVVVQVAQQIVRTPPVHRRRRRHPTITPSRRVQMRRQHVLIPGRRRRDLRVEIESPRRVRRRRQMVRLSRRAVGRAADLQCRERRRPRPARTLDRKTEVSSRVCHHLHARISRIGIRRRERAEGRGDGDQRPRRRAAARIGVDRRPVRHTRRCRVDRDRIDRRQSAGSPGRSAPSSHRRRPRRGNAGPTSRR